jgi:hypothetical protein
MISYWAVGKFCQLLFIASEANQSGVSHGAHRGFDWETIWQETSDLISEPPAAPSRSSTKARRRSWPASPANTRLKRLGSNRQTGYSL